MDWLGDVGGLRDALFIIGGFVIFIQTLIRGNLLEAWLIEAFFVKPSKQVPLVSDDNIKSKINLVKDRMPYKLSKKCCYYLRTSKEKRIIDKGIDRTFNELEVD